MSKRKLAFIILLCAMSLFITSCGPGQILGSEFSPTPTSTFTPTPTSTLTPTATLTNTPTPTATPLPPTPTEVYDISDIEFAKMAQEACNDLLEKLQEIYATGQERYPGKVSGAYGQAAEALGELHFTLQSAPMGYKLQTNMAQYAEVLDEFEFAFRQAVKEAGISGHFIYKIDESDYTIITLAQSTGSLTLDINSELVKNYYSSEIAFREAASELKLEGCAVKESDLNN